MHTELLAEGFPVAGIGITMVFGVLLLIAVVLSIFSVVSKSAEKKKNAKTAEAAKVSEQNEAIPDLSEIVSDTKTDDIELIAVITAAVAASMNTSSDKIVVRSLRKVSSWNEKNIYENQSDLQIY